MPRRPIVVLAFAAVLLNSAFARAQNTTPFREGARVRVDAPVLPATLYGQARTDLLDSNVLTISTTGNDARVSLPLASTSRIEVSDGRARGTRAKLGATLGLMAGGVGGAWVIGKTEGRSAVPVAALVFGGAGSVVGGMLGFAYAPERWRTVYSATASDTRYRVALRSGALVKQLNSGAIAVRGERNRRAGMVRGTAALGGLNLVFGGIDHARGNMTGREYASAAISNAVLGAAIGYLVSPRGWQELPSPAASASP